MTQEELAQAADVAPETVSRIERNRLSASLDLTRRLAEVMGLKVDELLNPPRASTKPVLRPADARLLHLVRDLDEPQVMELVKAVKTLMRIGATARKRT